MARKVFKIAAPLRPDDDIAALKKAGADELYCGYVDEESERLWPIRFVTINRRGKGQSFEGFPAFSAAMEKARRLGLGVYVTMNGLYTPEQYPWLMRTIDKISRLGAVRGMIVTDMGLLLGLKKAGYKKEINISTGGTTFNHYTAGFFASLGASRVIVDRQLTINEICGLVCSSAGGVGIEIFILGGPCIFIDGYCSFAHYFDEQEKARGARRGMALVKTHNTSFEQFGCDEVIGTLSYNGFTVTALSPAGKAASRPAFRRKKSLQYCNLCGLYELRRFPGITLKIAGREGNKLGAVRLVADAVRLAGTKGISRQEFRKRIKKLYFSVHGNRCDPTKCYLPAPLVRKD
jgi:collagenase-like PrtC family protease